MYLGIALYKMGYYEQCIKAYIKSNELFAEEPQLHYNLGLAYFKQEHYTLAVEHLKTCTQLDPTNCYAYNNLAFIYNMHQYYQETINVCNTAKQMLEKYERGKNQENFMRGNTPSGEEDQEEVNHTCHRHWAFALYKRGEMAKAIKQIKRAVQLDGKDPDNWIVWGLILRTVGNYKSAMHKFKQAEKLDPEN